MNIFAIVFAAVAFAVIIGLSCLFVYFGINDGEIVETVMGVLMLLTIVIGISSMFITSCNKVSKQCPICNNSFSDEYQYCPKDGTRLEE